MKVKGINHISLNVKDIKASIEFYGKVLGFRQLETVPFKVDDVDEAERHLREHGVKITLAATDLPSLGSRTSLFLDPNGVTLEYCLKIK